MPAVETSQLDRVATADLLHVTTCERAHAAVSTKEVMPGPRACRTRFDVLIYVLKSRGCRWLSVEITGRPKGRNTFESTTCDPPWTALELHGRYLERAMGIEPTRASVPELEYKRFGAMTHAKCD